MTTTRIKVTGLPSGVNEGRLRALFRNKQRQGGGPVECVHLNEAKAEAVIEFTSHDAVDLILSRGRSVLIDNVSVPVSPILIPVTQSVQNASEYKQDVNDPSTSSKPDLPPAPAERQTQSTLISHQEESFQEAAIVKANVINVSWPKESYILYLEDEEINTGNFNENEMFLDGLRKCLYISFDNMKDAMMFCEQNHAEESNILSATLVSDEDLNTYPNLLSVHSNNPIECSSFQSFLKEVLNIDCELEQRDELRSVMIDIGNSTFDELCEISWKLGSEQFDGSPLVTALVQRSTCALVTSPKLEEINYTLLKRYMANARNGGGKVASVVRGNSDTAMVTFESEKSLTGLLAKKNHVLHQRTLKIQTYFTNLTKEMYANFHQSIPLPQASGNFAETSEHLDLKEQASDQTNLPTKKIDRKGAKSLSQEHVNKEVLKEFKMSELLLLKRTGLESEINEEVETVDICIDTENATITLSGQDEKAFLKAKVKLFEFKTNTLCEKIVEVTDCQKKLLRKKEVLDQINGKLSDNDIFAILYEAGNVFRATCSKETLMDSILSVVKQYCVTEKIPLNEGKKLIFASRKGKDFIRLVNESDSKLGLMGKHCIVLIDKEESAIVITASESSQYKIKKAVDAFLEKNTVVTKEVLFSPNKLKYAKFFLQDTLKTILTHFEKEELVVKEDGDKFILRGCEQPVTVAETKLLQIREGIARQEIMLRGFGIEEYLKDVKGQQLIEEVGKANDCLFELKSHHTSNVRQMAKPQDSSVDPPNAKAPLVLASSQFNDCSVDICLGDILGVNADVLVHPVDSSLSCHGGLTKAIIQQGGKDMVQELRRHFQDSQVGSVCETSGILHFKFVAHVICPTKEEGSKDDLESCVLKSLKHLERRGITSVVLPAMGAGGNFKLHKLAMANNIMKALKKHLNEDSRLKQVFICDVRKDIVNQLIDTYEFIFEEDMTREKTSHDSPGKMSHPNRKRAKAPKKKDFGHIKVKIVSGELSDQQTDVIVSTVGKDLNLSSGVLSKSILQCAGDGVQDALTSNYPSGIGSGDMAETDGGDLSCSHIFFACVHKWKNGIELKMSTLVSKLLAKAEEHGASSISLPALGTGKLGYPPDTVAHTIMNCISKFSREHPRSSLQSVDLVVYHKDKQVYQTFQAVLATGGRADSPEDKSDQEEGASGSHGFLDGVKNFVRQLVPGGSSGQKFGSVYLNIKKGDITDEKCDAIVSGIKNSMILKDSGAVCKAIWKKCGQPLQDECSDKSDDMLTNGVAVTDSHGLPSDKIIHVSMNKFSKCWGRGVTAVLKEADQQGFKSLALPALGTGPKGVDISQLKSHILEAIKRFGEKGQHSLTNVHLVIFDTHVYDVFVKDDSSESEDTSQTKRHRHAVSPSVSVSEKAVLQVYHYNDAKKVNSAKGELNTRCRQNFVEKTYRRDELKKFDERQVHILELEGLYNMIKVKVIISSAEMKISTFFPINIPNVQEKLNQLVTKRKDMELEEMTSNITLAVLWQFKTGDKWRDIEPKMSLQIEAAFQKFNQSGAQSSVQHDVTDPSGKVYRLDLKNMKKFLLNTQGQVTKKSFAIRRHDKSQEGESLPPNWQDMDAAQSADPKLIQVDARSSEFKRVKDHFLKNGGPDQVQKIERVQNMALYQLYKVKKREMDKQNTGKKNEERLFHGTDSATVDSINKNGFNRNYCGKNATVYGEGVYFSRSANYSVNYAKPDTSGVRRMYQARVLVGKSTLSSSGMKFLPIMPGTKKPYDSGTDGQNMVIIFHDAQAYPEYLISF